MSWLRVRFRADLDDPRPVIVPPPGPWWCTGWGEVVAYVRPGQDIRRWWPEAEGETDLAVVETVVFSSRFPAPKGWDAQQERWSDDARSGGEG